MNPGSKNLNFECNPASGHKLNYMFHLLNAHYDGVDYTLDLDFDIRPPEGAKNLLVKNKHKKSRETIDFISKIGKFVNQFS